MPPLSCPADLRWLLIDMDGVLWHGQAALPGLGAFFDCLRRKSINFMLATNNACCTEAHYVERLQRLGVTVAEREVFTSALATAAYMRGHAPVGARIYVIGEEGLRCALSQAGFRLVDSGADYVVVGNDRAFNWAKLRQAVQHIHAGAAFIATNPDLTIPTEEGLMPENGVILAALTAATGVRPTIIGKPEPPMFLAGLERLNADPRRTAVIGDRLDTDILGAARAGLHSALLLTGATTLSEASHSPIRPTWIYPGLPELTAALAG